MAVEVLSSEFDSITYDGANKWVIDEFRQLHVVGENGNLASYASGNWASVHQVQPPRPTAKNPITLRNAA